LFALNFDLATARSAILPVGVEQDSWSDMAFATGVTGSYNSGTKKLTISATPSNDIELGEEFGPSNVGKHYGTGGTLGGPSPGFSATLNLANVDVQADGSVTAGGSVTVVYNGPPANGTNMASDYGIAGGSQLLVGSVLEVLLDATGDNTLDVLVDLSGGVLQTPGANLNHDVPVFAPNGRGVLRISGVMMPSDWSAGFSLNGAKIDFLGIPEPGTIVLGMLGLMLASLGGSRRRLFKRSAR
jgi:hypothetical protein